MASIEFQVERLLPCPCVALTGPWSCCPECGGDGESWQEIEVAVEYEWHQASRGARDRYGAQLEPDEPEDVEILSAADKRGVEVELTASESERVVEECLRDVEDRYLAAMEARAEARADALRYGW